MRALPFRPPSQSPRRICFGFIPPNTFAPFKPETDRSYQFSFSVQGDALSFAVDGAAAISATDNAYAYGMSGIRLASAGRISVGRIEIIEQD